MSDFDRYIRQGEPAQAEKARIWQTAIGLQDVDGLKPSQYLRETAQRHIEGDITIDDVRSLIDSYYKSKTSREQVEHGTEEADKVSAAITAILSENTFTFSPEYLISIHKRLFKDVYKFAGKIRDYNISKDEWILNGATVLYSDAYMIPKGIVATDQYLMRFFGNLILGENNTLSNREMHISSQSINFIPPKSQFDTLKCSFEELAILKAVADNPQITQDELKDVIRKSLATVKRITVSLQEKGILVRKNGKRNGYWEINMAQ